MRIPLTFRAAFPLMMLTATASAAPAAAPADKEDALPVQMLVPGFTVRELPIKGGLTNINNLEYTPDGRLFALGYDGRVHVLSDTDGDGVEDVAKTWWKPQKDDFRGPIGMALTREGGVDGLYVASKGKVTLLQDTDSDGTADKAAVVVTGWKEIFPAVDAVGVAVDKDNNLYFGRGCANFADAYQLNKQGKAEYDINSEYGTIMKVSPDRKSRQVLATGVRFSVGIAINRHGDVFFTDQEGDTWTKGNHLDELNVLLPGRRHYGFPERHPVHLPGTNDEPPVIGFGPQHQSTCGLKFNEASDWRKPFGPSHWENDALVIGQSRGKIWRAPLVKLPQGYVGRHQLIAAAQMLTIDCAIAPNGDLVICCHSGPPDWGTGPTGAGRLFKMSHANKDAPQPVLAWPVGNDAIRIVFDRPMDPSILTRLAGATVAAGEYVRAGDRHEVLRPPYAVVKAQLQTPRRDLRVTKWHLEDDRRTLVLRGEPRPWRSWYAVALNGVKAPGEAGLGSTVDVDFTTNGLSASWKAAEGDDAWVDWVPHPDPEVIAGLTRGSRPHAALLDKLARPGTLELQTRLDLPGKQATLLFESNGPVTLDSAGSTASASGDVAKATLRVDLAKPLPPLRVTAATGRGGKPPLLRAAYFTDADPTVRPLHPDSLYVPDTPLEKQPVVETASPPALTQGGDWKKGRELFFGDAKCSTCHVVRGEGTRLGPDLSNLVHLNPESVLRDIVEPNATINPDHVSYMVDVKNGGKLAGLLRREGEDLRVVENAEKSTL